ncbi:hypothetical protein MPL3365_200155 [Mesorhizobium plurifarium]|uniref:Uncharacterized protein n=1 Tax=Mesorhizobium plurifarium TaxID=69974 RepID=A0A090G3G5_MESPL|nr:hypothetical protein MPL3365_200155 [Mesorhizobium plurifarium]
MGLHQGRNSFLSDSRERFKSKVVPPSF